MDRRARFTLAAAALAGLGGCATQADVQYVQKEAKDIRGLVADNQASMQSLTREIERLRGEIETFRFEAGGSGTQLEQLQRRLDAIEARLGSLEQVTSGVMPPGLPGVPGAPLEPGAVPPVDPTFEVVVPAGAPEEYRQAAEQIRAGDFQGAIQRLREFLRQQPKSELADDVQYLIGESYFRSRDFNRAILEFNEVLLRYPKGDRVPAALLRQALAFAELGDKVDARLVLQKLLSEHGSTPEAEQGRQKLAELAS